MKEIDTLNSYQYYGNNNITKHQISDNKQRPIPNNQHPTSNNKQRPIPNNQHPTSNNKQRSIPNNQHPTSNNKQRSIPNNQHPISNNKQRPIPNNQHPTSNNHLTQQNNLSKKKKLSRPKNKNKFPKLKDSKNILAGIITAGVIVTGIGLNNVLIKPIREENKEIAQIAETFSYCLEETYENSEFLLSTLSKKQYLEYTQNIIIDTLKNEKSLKTLLKKENVDKNLWLYILSGEGDRQSISNEDIINILNQYYPYSYEVSFSLRNKQPNNEISYFADLARICTSQENQDNLVALFDAVIGGSSISNSKEAITFNQTKISEIKQKESINVLEANIEINNNFDYNIDINSNLYMQPYFDLYSTRQERAKDIVSGKFLNNIRKPNLLSNIVENIANTSEIDSYSNAKWGQFITLLPVEEYRMYIIERNNLYETAIKFLRNEPETNQYLENTSTTLQNTLNTYEAYEKKDKSILKEFYDLFKNLSKTTKEVKKIEEEINQTGFNDFSH